MNSRFVCGGAAIVTRRCALERSLKLSAVEREECKKATDESDDVGEESESERIIIGAGATPELGMRSSSRVGDTAQSTPVNVPDRLSSHSPTTTHENKSPVPRPQQQHNLILVKHTSNLKKNRALKIKKKNLIIKFLKENSRACGVLRICLNWSSTSVR